MSIIHKTTLTPSKLELLTDWLPAQPWYLDRGRAPDLAKAGGFRLDDPLGEVGIEFMVVTDGSDDQAVSYLAPMTYRASALAGADGALIGTTEHGVLGRRWVYDGISDPVLVGQLVALVGRSGSGKTTLLNIVGGLDTADGGSISVAGHDMTAMGEGERLRLRRDTVAYIFQSFGLLPVLSAAENVGVPLRIAGVAPKERESRVELLLSKVGLAEHAKQRPAELSGGQQQRVAIARALATQPSLLLADEPTGQLDRETGRQIMRLLRTVVESEGVTALVATHDPALIDLADSVLHLVDGKITA